MTHAIVPLAATWMVGRGVIPTRVALAGAALAVLPDADVIGFRFGVDYAAEWGHRGASHSLGFAALVTIAIAVFWREARDLRCAIFLFLAAASHGLLDMLTDGGLGVGLLWPAFDARLFWPWQPVRVSPIGAGFFTQRGWETVRSELLWIWVPALVLGAGGTLSRWRAQRQRRVKQNYPDESRID